MTMSIDSYRKYSLERGPSSKPREKTIYSPYAKTSFEFRSLVSPEAPAAYTPNSQQAPAAALAQNLRPSVARNDAIKTEIQAKKFTENRERSSNRLSPVVHVDATQTQPDAAATTAHVTITTTAHVTDAEETKQQTRVSAALRKLPTDANVTKLAATPRANSSDAIRLFRKPKAPTVAGPINPVKILQDSERDARHTTLQPTPPSRARSDVSQRRSRGYVQSRVASAGVLSQRLKSDETTSASEQQKRITSGSRLTSGTANEIAANSSATKRNNTSVSYDILNCCFIWITSLYTRQCSCVCTCQTMSKVRF